MKGDIMDADKLKKIFMMLAIAHTVEAGIAYRAAKKRGKNPKLYYCLTQFFGVFVLVPLLRQPKVKEEAQAVDL
jgi:hypothetical protein